jgi:hypothetical protein
VSIENHGIGNRLTDLVSSVNQLLDGNESVSYRWQGSVREGHFVDLVADPEGGVSVVVREFRHAEGTAFAEIRSGERVSSVFCAHVPLAGFTIAFATALRRMRSTEVDLAGMLHDCPCPFPQPEFERLEGRAVGFGHRPLPLLEIEHRAAPSE